MMIHNLVKRMLKMKLLNRVEKEGLNAWRLGGA